MSPVTAVISNNRQQQPSAAASRQSSQPSAAGLQQQPGRIQPAGYHSVPHQHLLSAITRCRRPDRCSITGHRCGCTGRQVSTCYQLLPGVAAGRPLQYYRSQVRLYGAAGQHLLPAITRWCRRPAAAVLPVTGAAAQGGRSAPVTSYYQVLPPAGRCSITGHRCGCTGRQVSTCYQLLPGVAAGRPLQYYRSQVRLYGAAGQHLLPAITRCRRRPAAAVLSVTGAAVRGGRSAPVTSYYQVLPPAGRCSITGHRCGCTGRQVSTCYQLLPGVAAGRPLQYYRSQVRLYGAAGQHLLPAITRCCRRPAAAVLPVTGAAARRGRPVCRRRPPRADTAGWKVIISVYGPTADAPGLLWRYNYHYRESRPGVVW